MTDWVLVSDGGSGQSRDAVAAVRALSAGGYRATITVSGTTSRFGHSKHVERLVPVPAVEEGGYRAAVFREMLRHDYVAMLPASEPALLAMRNDLGHLTNKARLPSAASAAGLRTPDQVVFGSTEEMLARASELPYPVVVKPAVRRFNAFRAYSPSDLHPVPSAFGEIVVQPFIAGEHSAASGLVWRGRIVGRVQERWLRTWPRQCGLASTAVTVAAQPELFERLRSLLEGYEGIFCAQMVDGYLVDLNLRVHSTHPLGVKAGVNLVCMYCDLMRGDEVEPRAAAPDFVYRWLEGDVRSIAAAVRKGEMGLASALHALIPRADTAHSIESLSDPAPGLARLRYAARRAHIPAERRRAG